MPRLLIVALLTAGLLSQGCADTNHGTIVARSADPSNDIWADRTPPVAAVAASEPGDVLKPLPQPSDPSMRDWMNAHPVIQLATALSVMTLGALAAYVSLTEAPAKKK